MHRSINPGLILRGVAVWLLLMAGETASGVLRTTLIAPLIGDLAARQSGVLVGSLIIVAVACLTSRWLGAATTRAQLAVGSMWVVLTVGFEITLGRALGYSWERIASDYDITEGGLLPIGLVIMALAPVLAARLRGLALWRPLGPSTRQMPDTSSSPTFALAAALGLFGAWTLATWLLEGRIETLLRPEAAGDRAIYAMVANLLIGLVVAIAVLRFMVRRGWLTQAAAGFGPSRPSAVRVVIGLGLGLAAYVVQGAPSRDPIVLTNAFSQVVVVSAAEVVVCWAVVGATVESVLRPRGRAVSLVGAAVVASVLFGLYHFAHSAPFNTIGMVALLTVVGLVTSAFFFVARDVYATIVFHNFLGMFGVVQALAASGRLDAFTAVQTPLVVMALATGAVLAIADWILLRRQGHSQRSGHVG